MHVAGYFAGVMGTGEHARQLLAALRTQRIPLTTRTLHPEGAPEDGELARAIEADGLTDDPALGRFADFNLVCANADMVPSVAAQLGAEFFANRYTIGFWAWEVNAFPSRYGPAFGHLNELWVGSRHVRDAVEASATVPVLAIPQPVSLPEEAVRAAPPPDLSDGFRFLFAFDYLSVFERKNPLAVIDAFTRAFPTGAGATLIVKSLNHEHNRPAHARLCAAVASHPDIQLIEERLTRAERDGLMNAADCYVSLHRAEGFGYTLAESMWLGKPVIATGYSGNLDFMTPNNSYLVRHRLVPIGPGHDPYPHCGQWAEPDLDHAARLMREVFEHRDEARSRGERAASEIRASHGSEVAGRAMVNRLELLTTSPSPRALRALHGDQPSTGRVADLIQSGPVAPALPRLGAMQRAARTGLLRLLKPVSVHQRLVDSELLRTVQALQESARSLVLGHEMTLRRIEKLEAEVRELRAAWPDVPQHPAQPTAPQDPRHPPAIPPPPGPAGER